MEMIMKCQSNFKISSETSYTGLHQFHHDDLFVLREDN